MSAALTPGRYLAKRRAVSGYSLSALAREIAALDGFGRARAHVAERRVQLRLIEAEDGLAPLSDLELALVAGYVPLDPVVYRDLVDLAERRILALPYPLCRSCGASETTLGREPFSGLPGTPAHFVAPELCSLCAAARPSPNNALPPPSDFQIVDIGARSPSHLLRAVRAGGA